MNEENIWIESLKNKYRYNLKKDNGNFNIGLENLFDLNLNDLNTIYCELDKELSEKNTNNSLLNKETDKEIIELNNKKTIIKKVFNIKEKELEKIENEVKIKQKKQKIMKIIAEKEDDALKELSTDELTELLNDL